MAAHGPHATATRSSAPAHAPRSFLERLFVHDPRIRTNLFAGPHNLKLEYLPRQKLYPGTSAIPKPWPRNEKAAVKAAS